MSYVSRRFRRPQLVTKRRPVTRRLSLEVLEDRIVPAGEAILVVTAQANPFSAYYTEILRAEGLNEFVTNDIGTVTPAALAERDVVVLGEMPLTASQVTMFSDWVTAGGNLIAMRPDKQLAGLLGLTDAASTRANAYLLVNTASGPGAGIVNETIQYHGTADIYTLNGASSVATLYSNATTVTPNPAVTLRSVGANGGQAAAFTYDLARSVVYTRQGNPAWSGQERDGIAPIRSNDLFYGNASSDPQPDWIDVNKIAIPQADEQQRLLANLIQDMNLDKKPLPRFWYLPRGEKAAVVMTGDDHGMGGTAGRFDQYIAASPPGASVDNWEAVRSTSYIFPNTPLSNAQAAAYVAQGFEVALHVNTNAANWTPAQLDSFYATQLAQFQAAYPGVPAPVTNRTHAIVWSDYVTQPKIELQYGIRFDTNYYHYGPSNWIQGLPGHMTGSAMPMRFADVDGTLIDVYQATTQMTDESGQNYPFTVNALLDAALDARGYYGVFTANMHTDNVQSPGSNAIVASALARDVPIVSARQMLTWLDGRNASSFSALNWNATLKTLSFVVTPGAGANGLEAMVPARSAAGFLMNITRDGSPVTYATRMIKGVEYAFFPGSAGTYAAKYGIQRITDTTGADFAAGAPDAGVAVVETGGEGDVILKPAAGSAEFSGTALPADWTGTPWGTGGATTVSGGRLTVDGAFARTAALHTPGRSLEFVATFSSDGFQHTGLANDFNSALWAMFSTGSGGALYARSAGSGGTIDTQLSSGLLGGPHRFRIEWAANGATTFFVDGAQVASHNVGVTSSMRPAASDFNVGGGTVAVDWMRLTPYAASGTFLSRVLDAGGTVNWNDAAWTAGLPSGTSLAMNVRMGNTPTPDDGTWTNFTPVASSGAAITGTSRYLQYRANLATTSPEQTPVLQSVTFQYATNVAPVANNDAYSTNEDTPLTQAAPGVLGNDTVGSGSLTAVLVSGPANGTLTLNPNGSFTYTPATNYNGADSFTYKANDGSLDSNVATVSLTVTAVNDAPVPVADSYSTAEDTQLTVNAPGLLGNDADVEGSSLTALLVAGPSHGTLTLNSNGSFTYTPAANYNGVDSFTYKANDGSLDSNVATVSLTVSAVNDAPVAVGNSYSTGEDTPLTVNVPGLLGNDTDVDGSSLTALLVAGPSHGTLTLNSNGSFTYTPAANYNGADSFTYKANDGNLDSNVATVSLTVTAVNDAPVAVGNSHSTAEDTPLTVNASGLLGNDTDAEGNSLTAVLVVGPSHGTLTLNSNGSFTYTPAANYNGADSFTYKANDGNLDSNVATVSLTVTAVNDAPVAVGNSHSTAEDTPLTVNAPGLLGNDTDAEGNSLTAVLVAGPSHGTLTLNSNGSFTYTPAANYNGADSFTYKANDGALDSNVATVSLTVTAVNDAPVAVGNSHSTAEDTPLTVNAPGLLGNDTDTEGSSLTAVLVAGPSHGTLTLNSNGSFTYTPAANYSGADSFTYKANDGALDSNVATVSLTVTAVNDTPVAVNDSYSTAEDTPLTVNVPGVRGNDTDLDGDSLTVALVSEPAHGTLTLNSNGSFTYTPAANYSGADGFTYRVNDGSLNSNVATVSLTVTAVNDAPVAVSNSYSTAEEITLNVTAPGVLSNDIDVDGDTLTAVVVSGPSHGTLTLNANGSFTYTPAAAYNGPDSFTYQARDPSGALSNVVTASFTVTPPTITISNVSANESNLLQTASFTFTVTLSSATSRTITVDYATANGTATAGFLFGDYLATSGTLTFQGQISRTIVVTVNGDLSAEPNETFFVNLSDASTPLADNQGLGTIQNDDGGALHVAGREIIGSSEPALTSEELAPMVTEGMARWQAAGMDESALAVLRGYEFRIADLPGTTLGASSLGVIYIDVSAAGHGWFVDPTPHHDSEFLLTGDQGEQGRIDLLTAVVHEMGHALGLEHSKAGVMQEELEPGVRHGAGCGCSACASAANAAATPAPQAASVPAPSLTAANDDGLLGVWLVDVGHAGLRTGSFAGNQLPSNAETERGDGLATATEAAASVFELNGLRPGTGLLVGHGKGTSAALTDPLADGALLDRFFGTLAGAMGEPGFRHS